jgi:catechol 2,3-dioxygenase-like lactoylglutathione lyase family enzyme
MATTGNKPNMDIEFLIDHVAVSVSNLARSIDFYEQNFGFTCQRVFEMSNGIGKVALLKKAAFTVEMFAYSDALPLPDYRKTPDTDLKTLGVKHFALNVDDIFGASNFLKRNGVDFISEVTVGGRGLRRFFIKDPDGIGIEVTESGLAPMKD